jgi:hypothetical protein
LISALEEESESQAIDWGRAGTSGGGVDDHGEYSIEDLITESLSLGVTCFPHPPQTGTV